MALSRRKQRKKPFRHEFRAFQLMVILLISFTLLSDAFLKNQDEIKLFPSEMVSVTSLKDNSKDDPTKLPIYLPSFDIHSSQNPHILFIVADPASLDPSYDKPFVDFINITLGFNVTLHDDNNSYAYAGYDAIVISDSIAVDQVKSLTNESIPILTMESYTFTDFRLGSGRGVGSGSEIYVIDSNHYITLNETNDTAISVYTAGNDINFIKGYGSTEPSWSEIKDLSRRVWNKDLERTILALDKGKKDWNNVSAAERRTFWGATQGNILNQKGWELWNRTLRWVLYDDINGSATINVQVKDLDNQDVPNAEVNLTLSFDATQKYSQNTSVAGQTTFSNIPYGSYNLTVEFEDSINDTLVFLNITGQQTFNLTADFNYIVRINEYIDNDPPSITNVGFFPSNRTFHAEVSDTSTLTMVNLSLTASNTTYTRNQNYTMVTLNGILYFNESAAQDLTAVNVTYNITAIDIAGNTRISENFSFLLGDITPPQIYEYNVTDYKNGTLEFYANITDKQSDVQDPVILKINDSYMQMHLNASGYWIYRVEAYYDITLNYTIWSANDSIGNENGTKQYSLTPKFGLTTPKDDIEPHIWLVEDSFATHDNGKVTFSCKINDWNEFQSGVITSSVQLTVSVNGVITSYPMNKQGIEVYDYEIIFDYEDIVYYWINASDLAGNINPGIVHGPFIIDDNAIPLIVSYWAEEWGNGTVDFYAEITDWPNNETSAVVSFTQNWFVTPWPNVTMIKISETQFRKREYSQGFQLQDIWYYVTVNDSSENINEPPSDKYKNIIVTDQIPPVITFTVENSILKDGEITVTAYAIDVFSVSNFVNNTFYINMTSESTTIETTMIYDPILRNWYKTQDFPYGEEVDIVVGVHDDAENFGKNNKTMVIDDLAPPNILNYGPTAYQNGTVIIWADVAEGEYGSGLPETNSSIIIEYIDIFSGILVNETMTWNGSRNFYTYVIKGFKPGQSFTYKISASDKKGNNNETIWQPVSIYDLTPPICESYNYQRIAENHYSTEFLFWADAYDDFGEISQVNLTINCYNNTHSWNHHAQMHYNGSFYIHSISMIRNYSFNYSILIYDGIFTIEVKNSTLRTLSFQPVELLEYGIDTLPSNIGEVLFWCKIFDPFNDHEALLSVFDDDNQSWILEETQMIVSNETNHYFFVSMNYSQNYTYTIEIKDSGSNQGCYDSSEGFGSGQMEDYWRPSIHDSGMDPINDTSILCWANVSDWGPGIQGVFLKYEFISGESNGVGSSIQVITVPMKFNGSLYITELIINKSGTFKWSIEAYDAIGISTSHFPDFSVFPPGTIAYSIEEIIIFISIALLLLGIPLYVVRTIRVRRSVKFKRIKKIEDKLSIISNVYTILLTTEVGVPVYTATNIMYQKDQNLVDVLSGVSVSIDTFLQSFQADFMQQVQQQDSEISETESGIDIRMSVIEQHEVQVLILATDTYRLFVFLREQPSKFTRDAFYQAIEDLEKNIHIQNVGIVDERVYEPHVELILQKYFPLTLLEPFVIDTIKLQRFDEGIKRGKSDVPLSSPAINSLKRLVVTHTLSKGKEANFDKIFNEAVKNGSLLESRMLVYNDAKEIMIKFLKIPPQQIYEALWIGSAPDVRVIMPQRV